PGVRRLLSLVALEHPNTSWSVVSCYIGRTASELERCREACGVRFLTRETRLEAPEGAGAEAGPLGFGGAGRGRGASGPGSGAASSAASRRVSGDAPWPKKRRLAASTPYTPSPNSATLR